MSALALRDIIVYYLTLQHLRNAIVLSPPLRILPALLQETQQHGLLCWLECPAQQQAHIILIWRADGYCCACPPKPSCREAACNVHIGFMS